ncbi:hypothetical protein LRH25_19170 [Ideonella azotifigens]|uniref:Tetratricopeptide repeat protein n=1 Tax=Ideonella azotifigens TaxID=513160 RepID=A0ABN1K5T2_9BURK|nr:hypothetical protein [Ideonella azotifigens]MCD2342453.1 hypothetical protein [Ideonella azotifigens]
MNLSSIGTGAAAQALSAAGVSGKTAMSFHELGKSLRKGDIEGAKQAYADILKNPPEGATWDPNSAFAQLGKDLAKGDIDGAKAIAADAIKSAREQRGHGSTTGGPIVNQDPTPPDAESMAVSGSISLTA